MSDQASVCVIIAAKDAAATIGRAVRSALAEPQVAEVIAVDDGSGDATAAAARAADDGSGRLRVERLPVNRGPSAARNHAIAVSHAPLLAILDADDLILPGRFARLLAIPDWDIVADNIVFVPDAGFDPARPPALPPHGDAVRTLDLMALMQGSTHRRSRARTQLGFLKPVMRRAMLDRAGVRYDERLRLGEDSVLYAALLTAGARFRLTQAVGYLAVERGDSLSARHATADLLALLTAERGLAARMGDAPAPVRAALDRRVAETRRKWAVRAFLDVKRERGMGAAIVDLARRPGDWIGTAEILAADKLRAATRRFAAPPPPPGPRLLLP